MSRTSILCTQLTSMACDLTHELKAYNIKNYDLGLYYPFEWYALRF